MSRENVEIVRRVYEAVTSHEAETVLALYDPNVEWDMSRGAWADLESDGIYHGHEGLRSWFRRPRPVGLRNRFRVEAEVPGTIVRHALRTCAPEGTPRPTGPI